MAYNVQRSTERGRGGLHEGPGPEPVVQVLCGIGQV